MQRNEDWGRTAVLLPHGIRLGGEIHAAPEMPSTQIAAKEAARRGAPHGTVFVADYQSAGRGRRDRAWHSLPGRDLMFSVVLRPAMPTAQAPSLCFAAACAVVRAVRALIEDERRAAVKWPNDVLLDGRKLCGIICESAADAATLAYAVLGIGINANRTEAELPPLDSPDRPAATSLLLARGRPVDRAALLAAVLSELDPLVDLLETADGPTRLMEIYKVYCDTLGRDIRILTDEGERVGRAVDIAPDGAIVLEQDGRRTAFLVGDVVHARALHAPRGDGAR